MIQVELNNKSNNPFYGLKNCLNLMHAAGSSISESMLDNCWNEVKDNKEYRELFFSILFSIGDITGRQHNIFGKDKKDNGGNANREGFYSIFNWLKDNHKSQFIKFLNAGLFNEYQCFDTLFRSRIQTKRTRVIKTYDIFADEWYRKELVKYIYKVVKGTNPFNKFLVAKFLTPPRFSRRQGHKQLLPETRKVMENKAKFLAELSKLVGWEYILEGNTANFKGYRMWRKDYNGELESVLFSTGKINDFDRDQFLKWFDALPSQARFRTKNRILYSKKDEKFKWAKFQPWIEEWEKFKENKQQEQRILEEKVRQNQATEEDKIKLEKVKKEAKVNVGATNFLELYDSILGGNVDKLKVESFIQNKINLPYNTLVLIDDSGSMSGAPFRFASFIAAVCLCKNPDDDARNLLGFFGSTGRFYGYIDKETVAAPNSLMRRTISQSVHKPFVDPAKSFMENFENIYSFCHATFEGGCTDLTSILKTLVSTMQSNSATLDALKNYPVWTIISDGEINNCWSPEASFNDFFRQCEKYLGFKPFIVAIDIANRSYQQYFTRNVERFSGIDNLIYIPSNPAQIEMFLTNFKDIDIFDVYTPLQSIYRSNRYELVRANTL